MSSWCRALLAVFAAGAVLLLASPQVAQAETPSPTPPASSPATASTTPPATDATEAADDPVIEDSPDVALDNTRTIAVFAGAGVLALIAATVVFLRR